jgi:HYR domain
MHRRPLRRATILAVTGLLAFAGTAMADQLLADGNLDMTGIQGTKFLGNVVAGAEVSQDVQFTLTCTGLNHVDLGQSVVLSWSDLGSEPDDGRIVSVTSATVGPATEAWAGDAAGCPDPVPSMTGPTLSHVTLRAPTSTGIKMFTIVYDRTLSPVGNLDGSTFSRSATQVSFTMNVIPNTPPTLTVPASHDEEGNATGGWTADWSDVTATDPEDDPDPTPSCLPAAGTKLLLDTTTHVVCSVTDLGGSTVSGAFDVTVVDTTAPTLSGVPSDIHVTIGDPGGAAVSFATPAASDVVDPSPTVGCLPASGSTFAVGTTDVTCTATDSSGNASKGSFSVEVTFVSPHTGSAIWLEPVGDGETFAANHSRTIPVKVRLFVDGVEQSTGDVHLTMTPCGGDSVAQDLTMSFSGGRWNASIDTSTLPGACYSVAATIDGLRAGSFRLDLGASSATARQASTPTFTTGSPKRGPKGR